jgi:glycine/serine hydroxymethyltransferase
MPLVASWIDRVVSSLDNEAAIAGVRAEVSEFTASYPAPGLSFE